MCVRSGPFLGYVPRATQGIHWTLWNLCSHWRHWIPCMTSFYPIHKKGIGTSWDGFIRLARFRTSREPLAGKPNGPVKYFNLGVSARTKDSMHPRGTRSPESPMPPLYPVDTKGPLRPFPDEVPHRVIDAWRDLRVWGRVDVEVDGFPFPSQGGTRGRSGIAGPSSSRPTRASVESPIVV